MPDKSVDCCVTSPPYYGLRDYGVEGQIGREATPEQYVERLAEVFVQLYRVLSDSGTFWLNISDSYCGTGSKVLDGILNGVATAQSPQIKISP